MRILICNSVGKDSQGDNYILFPSRWSARVGKHKSFNFYPYELGYLSALLKRETKNTVRMVDGNLENLNVEEYFEKYKFFRPDWLVMESSSVIYDEDKRLALKFKDKFKTKDEIFDLFLEAEATGKLLKVGRLVESSLGKGSFRELGEKSAD